MLLVVTHTRLAESDRELAELACGIAAVALDEVHRAKEWLAHEQARSEGELERRVQRQMLPAEDLMLAELAVSGHSRPCEGTGGDYYQFTRVGSEVFAAIGDVSGHGFASALYTTMAHTALLQAVHLRPLDAMFAELSDHLCRYAVDGKYMTAFAALLNPVTGRLRWTNAGHNPVLLVRADGTAAWLEAQGIPLGMFEGATYPIQELTLAADDCLIMFTDGIVEASVDGQEYGDARLERIAIANRAASSRALATALFTDFDRFLEGTSAADDASVVVMKMASAR
jgi:sigma-B regulation protein RsbU (phosphoserine phosphatase)